MKKLLVVLIALLALLMTAGTAQAARKTGGLVGIPRPREGVASRSTYSVTADKTTCEAGEPITFTVTYPEGGCYALWFCVDDHTYENPYILDTLWVAEQQTESRITYDMAWIPGNYGAFVYYYSDPEGKTEVDSSFISLTVTECSGTNTLYAMVRQVAAANRGANDYETFLNLYNWLMDHNAYDWDFRYYSAESVFLLGTGVCNSYSRALKLLLAEAGIPCRRVVGLGGGGDHAWNVVRLDGVWAQFDATWDDPDGDYESNYYYCGLSDEYMGEDHDPEYIQGGSVTCPTLRIHHWVRTGRWTDFRLCYDTSYEESHDFGQEILDRIQGGDAAFGLDCAGCLDGESYYMHRGGYYDTMRPLHLDMYAAGLSLDGLALNDADLLDVSADFDRSASVLSVSVLGWKNAGSGELDLPEDLQYIEERAFEGTDAAHVSVPEGCLSIGDCAFLNSGVQCATIPGAGTAVGTDAFSGCSPLMIIAPDDSPAAAYAEAHGILRLRP